MSYFYLPVRNSFKTNVIKHISLIIFLDKGMHFGLLKIYKYALSFYTHRNGQIEIGTAYTHGNIIRYLI